MSDFSVKKINDFVVVSLFDVMNSRKVSALWKAFSMPEGSVNAELVLLGNELSYKIGGAFPLQTEEVRRRNMRILGWVPVFVDERGALDTVLQRCQEKGVSVLLLKADGGGFRKEMKKMCRDMNIRYFELDAFTKDNEDFLSWRRSREG